MTQHNTTQHNTTQLRAPPKRTTSFSSSFACRCRIQLSVSLGIESSFSVPKRKHRGSYREFQRKARAGPARHQRRATLAEIFQSLPTNKLSSATILSHNIASYRNLLLNHQHGHLPRLASRIAGQNPRPRLVPSRESPHRRLGPQRPSCI